MKQLGQTQTSYFTPIEIVLGVDERGMTTAKKLYEFLELDSKNYSRWCKANITDNGFADENVDYEVFVIREENPQGGRPTQDFKLTAQFAKKLSMTAKNERGEQARNYFIKAEDKLKEISMQVSQISEFKDEKEKIKLMNARSRMANTYMRLANVETLSKEYKNILVAKAAETLSGQALLPLPKQEKKTYSASEIGQLLGVSSQKVGRVANVNNLKTADYGEFYRDKSPYSSKEVDSFRYYENAIPMFERYLFG